MRHAVVEIEPDDGPGEHARHPPDVVGVVVARDEKVDRVHAEPAELGQDSHPAAGVNQGGLAAFAHEDGVGLADVEEAELELLS